MPVRHSNGNVKLATEYESRVSEKPRMEIHIWKFTLKYLHKFSIPDLLPIASATTTCPTTHP